MTRKQTVAKQEVELTADERNQLQQTRGKLAYAVLAQIVTDPSWASLPTLRRRRSSTACTGRRMRRLKPRSTETLIPRARQAAQRQQMSQVA